MRVTTSVKGEFANAMSWLKATGTRIPTKTLQSIGEAGVASLRSQTPIGPTGRTSQGWGYKIQRRLFGADLVFYNNAHMDKKVNIALIMQLGHGTGTGGYVAPIDYINPALNGVFNGAGDKLAKEMFK